MKKREPDTLQMEEMIRRGAVCFSCNESRCFEYTEAGTHVCPHLQYWNGQPVRRSTLARWRTALRAGAPARRIHLALPSLHLRHRG